MIVFLILFWLVTALLKWYSTRLSSDPMKSITLIESNINCVYIYLVVIAAEVVVPSVLSARLVQLSDREVTHCLSLW